MPDARFALKKTAIKNSGKKKIKLQSHIILYKSS